MMTKHCLTILFSAMLLVNSAVIMAGEGTGLEIDNARQINVVFTLEAEAIDKDYVQTIALDYLRKAKLQQHPRDDAQLFLRVEQHAGEYLLYLDFNRRVKYHANGRCFSKEAFVWGRFVKDIDELDDLYDDIDLLFEEFVEAYVNANEL
jgi:hypothetical protein